MFCGETFPVALKGLTDLLYTRTALVDACIPLLIAASAADKSSCPILKTQIPMSNTKDSNLAVQYRIAISFCPVT
jgi:hypothetical protein